MKIKKGSTPESRDDKPDMKCQKDRDARCTKKHDKSCYGNKNSISIDKQDKLMRRYNTYKVADAAVHNRQVFSEVPDEENSGQSVWIDSTCRSEKQERRLKEKGYIHRIHYKRTLTGALNKRRQTANHARSKTSVRVKPVFGDQNNTQCGILIRTKGIVRAAVKIGVMNLICNMR